MVPVWMEMPARLRGLDTKVQAGHDDKIPRETITSHNVEVNTCMHGGYDIWCVERRPHVTSTRQLLLSVV